MGLVGRDLEVGWHVAAVRVEPPLLLALRLQHSGKREHVPAQLGREPFAESGFAASGRAAHEHDLVQSLTREEERKGEREKESECVCV